MCINLVVLGIVFSVFFHMFGVTQTPDIQTALDNSQFIPKEILLGMIGFVFLMGGYMVYLTINKFEIKSKVEEKH